MKRIAVFAALAAALLAQPAQRAEAAKQRVSARAAKRTVISRTLGQTPGHQAKQVLGGPRRLRVGGNGAQVVTVEATPLATLLDAEPPAARQLSPWAISASDAATMIASPQGIAWMQRRVWRVPPPPARLAEIATATAALDKLIAIVEALPATADIADEFQDWGSAGPIVETLARTVTDQALVFDRARHVFGYPKPKHEILASLRSHRARLAYAATGEQSSNSPHIAVIGATDASSAMVEALFAQSDLRLAEHASYRNPAGFTFFAATKPRSPNLGDHAHMVDHNDQRIVAIERHVTPAGEGSWIITTEAEGKTLRRGFDALIIN